MTEHLAALKVTRGVTKGQLTKIKNYSNEKARTANIFELKTKLALLENYYKKFDEVQTLIEQTDEKEIAYDERDVVDEDYCLAKSRISSAIYILEPRESISLSGHNSTVANATPHIKAASELPRLTLPKFNGDFSKWMEFWNQFSQMVDENTELDDVRKFQYLKGCLEEKVSSILQSLDVTSENYKKAVEKLKMRYDNKRFIFQSHIKEIFASQDIKSNGTEQLRTMIDKVTSHVESLLSIATKEQVTDGILLFMISQRLDSTNKTRWEDEITKYICENTNNENRAGTFIYPTWDHFTKFVEIRCQTQENIAISGVPTSKGKATENIIHNKHSSKKTSLITVTGSPQNCVFCKQNHNVFGCQHFNSLDQAGRYNEARRLNLCLNCLWPGHNSKKCNSTKTCHQCHGKHHTLLHFTRTPQITKLESQHSTDETTPPAVSNLVTLSTTATDSLDVNTADEITNPFLFTNSHSRLPLSNSLLMPQKPHATEVILSTAIVTATNSTGNKILCRTLLDGGSQPNFITKRFASILDLEVQSLDEPIHISGIAAKEQTINSKVSVVISSTTSSWSTMMDAYILNTITPYQPSPYINRKVLRIPENIKLADPKFYKPQKIDFLIGNGHFLGLLSVGQISISENLLLQKTHLGWIVGGSIEQGHFNRRTCLSSVTEELSIENIERILGIFWKTDDLVPKNSTESNSCEEHFQRTHTRLPDGRYQVSLPFKNNSFELGNSYDIAMKCFLNLERKLNRNADLKRDYSSFIEEYHTLGHLEPVSSIPENQPHFFLPHHPVLKDESSSTKLRVVFNASKKTTNGKSLNDILMVGPTIQDDLFNILLRFRMHRYILGADITKMYRQVLLQDDDQWLQLILWRKTVSEPIGILKLKTVTYGTAPAAFLAIRSLVQLALDEKEDHPLASRIVMEDFYVDNLLTGSDDISFLKQVKNDVTDMLRKGNFPLRKWISNSDELLCDIADADKEKSLKINNDLIIKTLGMAWQNSDDVFIFTYNQNHSKITKRTILSEVSSFFDPAGLISPVILTAKLFIQNLWQLKLQWDESLPQDLHTQWETFRLELEQVKQIRIPRHASMVNSIRIDIHGFCDASLKAYAACIFLRSFDANGNCNVNLLCSKTRVAGLKPSTIARLELCGAHLLAELMSTVVYGLKSTIKPETNSIYLWTDSAIVLCWLRSDPSTLKTFVSNRVAQVQALTRNAVWNHIPGALNPADWGSRGKNCSQLEPSALWFKGPDFLRDPFGEWPNSVSYLEVQDIPERKIIKYSSMVTTVDIDLIKSNKFANSYQRLLRVFSYVYRFIHHKPSQKGKITSKELQTTLHLLCKYLQQMYFQRDYERLFKNQQVESSSKLKALAPFLDSKGVMRVGGRTRNADLAYDQVHQLIIPKDHPFTEAIITFLHIRNHHCGEQALLYALRQQFWVLSGRRKVRSVTRKCIRCFRAKPLTASQILGQLPRDRLQPARPFTVTGLDFCGPFQIRPGRRGERIIKQYIAIFVCFFCRAVHMEIVTDLSTDAFMSALKRFISRRGKPTKIHSDNATNFIGARNQLKELHIKFTSEEHNTAVYNYCLEESIDWLTIPPRSPHFGGLWEAAVKIAKYHIVRVFASFIPRYEEFITVICQVEAVMNSRPLSPMSSDVNDFEVLTPGHFLIGAPLNSINEPQVTDSKFNRLSHFQQLSQLHQLFEKRWKHEVINSMQQLQKNTSIQDDLKIGDLVLLVEDNYPTMKWPRGRIIKTYPSPDDNLVRVVDVQIPGSNNIMKRAVKKVCKLPMHQDEVDRCINQPGEYVRDPTAATD